MSKVDNYKKFPFLITLCVFCAFNFPLNCLAQGSPKLTLQEASLEAFHNAMEARYASNKQKEKSKKENQKALKPLNNDEPFFPPSFNGDFPTGDFPISDLPVIEQPLVPGNSALSGEVYDPNGIPIEYATIVLYNADSKAYIKSDVSNSYGQFELNGLHTGRYHLVINYLGYSEIRSIDFELNKDDLKDLGNFQFNNSGVQLSEVEVVAARPIVEVKADRTNFNVSGNINSTGSNAIGLLRKAPMVMVDQNNEISIAGRPGAAVYIDGDPAPFSGDQLAIYLQSLTADQIDRIEIITNPGVEYDAQGAAGIIDIIMKEEKGDGLLGSIAGTISKGKEFRSNVNSMLKYSAKKLDIGSNLSFGKTNNITALDFFSNQNEVFLDGNISSLGVQRFRNFQLNGDYNLNKKSKIGFDFNKLNMSNHQSETTNIDLTNTLNQMLPDSVLVTNGVDTTTAKHTQLAFDYEFKNRLKGTVWKLKSNHGKFNNVTFRNQPNRYFDPETNQEISSADTNQELPATININSIKVDHSKEINDKVIKAGAKINQIKNENLFGIASETPDSNSIFELQEFDYKERTFALYGGFSGTAGKFNYQLGLRSEWTKATGESELLSYSRQDTTVQFSYFNLFPNVVVGYQIKPNLSISTSYSRRIRRPDFSTLNPFTSQSNDLNFEQGNPILNPEIVNSLELGLTFKYRYNLNLIYSDAANQITPFNTPVGETDQNASLFSWNNINKNKQYSLSLSAPIAVTKWWDSFNMISLNRSVFQSSFDGPLEDINSNATIFSIFNQNTFKLPIQFSGDINFRYMGEGLYNGVVKNKAIWELSAGIKRSLFENKMNVSLTIHDIFNTTNIKNNSSFSGLSSDYAINFDNRRVALTLSYQFGKKTKFLMPNQLNFDEEADDEDSRRVGHRGYQL